MLPGKEAKTSQRGQGVMQVSKGWRIIGAGHGF